jgi:hypothetical protein
MLKDQAKATGCGVLCVISFANHQWGMKKTPTDGSLTLFLIVFAQAIAYTSLEESTPKVG